MFPVFFYLLNVQEHEERIGFLRERHELEGKIMTLQDMLERSGDEEQVGSRRGTDNWFGTDGEQRTGLEQTGER